MTSNRRSARLPLVLFGAGMLVANAAWAQRPDQRQRGGEEGHGLEWRLKQMDANGDGKIARDEFTGPEKFFEKMDADSDGFVTAGEVESVRRKWSGRRQRDDGAPKAGDAAPTFKLRSLDGKNEFDLASFKGNKPVVLLFGSYT